ncbi:MAG: GNAT family N-acetyltransferase [Geminicoccaceae bacterium]
MSDIVVRCVDLSDSPSFDHLADGLFDDPIDRDRLNEFLVDPHHHLAIAQDGETIVGFASGVDYIHPDKARELWINEVSVASNYRRLGLGKAIIARLLEHGRGLGCAEAWVLTDASNKAARSLYRSSGGEESECVMVSFDLSHRP